MIKNFNLFHINENVNMNNTIDLIDILNKSLKGKGVYVMKTSFDGLTRYSFQISPNSYMPHQNPTLIKANIQKVEFWDNGLGYDDNDNGLLIHIKTENNESIEIEYSWNELNENTYSAKIVLI